MSSPTKRSAGSTQSGGLIALKASECVPGVELILSPLLTQPLFIQSQWIDDDNQLKSLITISLRGGGEIQTHTRRNSSAPPSISRFCFKIQILIYINVNWFALIKIPPDAVLSYWKSKAGRLCYLSSFDHRHFLGQFSNEPWLIWYLFSESRYTESRSKLIVITINILLPTLLHLLLSKKKGKNEEVRKRSISTYCHLYTKEYVDKQRSLHP